MNENGETPPVDALLCERCTAVYDQEDNFCRHCGLSLRERHLPSVQDGRELPTVWEPPLPAAVVKGAAFVAAGTLAEVLVRRLVRGMLGRKPRTSRAPARQAKGEVVPRDDSMPEDAQLVSETFLLRRVRIRR